MSYPLVKTKIFTADDYYKLPENIRAELINGQFYNMSAPNRIHQEILNFLNTEINIYLRSKKGSCRVYPAPFAVRLFKDNKTIVEPDISIICDPDKLTDRGCTGAPDWIIEIVSPSNPEHDYIHKLHLYADAGVREYWIVNPMNQTILIYHFGSETFQVQQYTFQDKIKVSIYEDFEIALKELNL